MGISSLKVTWALYRLIRLLSQWPEISTQNRAKDKETQSPARSGSPLFPAQMAIRSGETDKKLIMEALMD